MATSLRGGGSYRRPSRLRVKDTQAGKGFSPFGGLGGAAGAALGGMGVKPPGIAGGAAGAAGAAFGGMGTPAPAPEDDWATAIAYGDSLGGGGGGGGGSLGGTAGPALDPLSDPTYLAALAGIDTSEASAVGAARARQEAARRALDDLLGDIANREQKSMVRSKESQETRGLLRSGATERLLADVAEAAGGERSKGQSSTADAIADLERQIAESKAAAAKSRADLALQYQGLGGVL